MVRQYLLVAILLTATFTTSWAGITGILTGKVTDKDGKPVPGATVKVMETTRGGITKLDGKYTVMNVIAGSYNVRVTSVGYDTVIKRVSIVSDQTLNIDFTLLQGGVRGKEVIVSADREMVRNTDVGTSRVIKGDDMTKIARDNVASALSLNAGIRASGNNYVVRGSRPTETQVLVDGLTVTDQFTGGLGQSGSTISAAVPSPFATEEVQAQTGGFGAEYGNAIGGIVNTVVKTGKTDRFDGLIRWRKDVPFMFGTAGNGVDAGYPLEDVVDVTLGGPLGFNKSTFFIAVRNTYQNHRNLGLQVLDPIGNNLGMQPNNRTWSRNITSRLRFQLDDDIALLVGGMYGILNGERNSWGWLYANDQGILTDNTGNPLPGAQFNGIPERNAKQVVVQEFSTNAFAQINHTLGANTVYEIRGSYNGKTTETGKRRTYDTVDGKVVPAKLTPNVFNGFDLYYPVDNLAFNDSSYISGESNTILDAYEYLRQTAYTEDGYVKIETTKRNPITGYVEGPPDAQSTNNPYGLYTFFASHGNEGGVDFRNATFFQVDGNITSTAEFGETRHTVKAGIEFRSLNLARHNNGSPWDGSPFYDVYGDLHGGNLYFDTQSDDPTALAAKAESEKPYSPITGAVFVQDQIMFKGLIFTSGVRLDYINADAMYRTSYDAFYAFGDAKGFEKVEAKLYVSPRISIAFPIADGQNFQLSYGIYYQAPPFSDFYDSFNAFQLRGSQVLGNPNMEMSRTNQYQVAYNHQLTDNLAVTITGYYKDIYNQAGLAYVRVVPIPFFQRVLADYGSSRGLELTLQKNISDNWMFNFNYTISSARGTSNTSSNTVALDPFTNDPAYPVTDFPLDFDLRNRVNGQVSFNWGNDEGPSIGGITFLEYFTITLSGSWQSGLPYTPVNLRGQSAGEINSARFPSTWNSEMRITRTIPLDGILGGNTAVDLTLDVTNLLNFTGAISFYPTTGSPDLDGNNLARQPSDFPAVTYYKDADPGNKATIATNQYDRVGKRLYQPLVDFNRDGRVTNEETYMGYLQYKDDVIARRGNYQYPRTAYFAVTFRF
ncbi:MAG: TonB-dependent receptor [Candidatus Kapabacteria bacterium]|nr:TonB-dependent receptor [Candidatus Kapabacteria bacterium]